MQPEHWILLALAVVMVAPLVVMVLRNRGSSTMKIDPAKQAKRQARRADRRERIKTGVQKFGKGVREGLNNLDDREKAEIKAAFADTAKELVEAGQMLAVMATAVLAAKKPNPVTIALASKEIREAGQHVFDLLDLVDKAIED